MSFADARARKARQTGAAPPTTQLSANELALEEEEEAAAQQRQRQPLPDGPIQVSTRGEAAREQAHERFLQQYTADATQVAEVFAELGQHLEQQQDSLDKVEDNTNKAVDELREGIAEYADGAKEKARLGATQKTLVAGAVGGATAVAAFATGGIALGVAAGAAAVVGGLGAQAEYKLVADAAQGEVEVMEVQHALGPLMDKKDWSPDAEACERCSVAFSMFLRRHHCRSCGGVFCANCAPKQAIRLCTSCSEKKAAAGGRKIETSGTDTSSRSGEDTDLMATWSSSSPASNGASNSTAGVVTRTTTDNTGDRTALLSTCKQTRGKGVSAAEAEALRAAERAASVGAAAASKVSDQSEQIHGIAGSANTAAEVAARAERVDQCYSTFGAIKMAWSRGASLVKGERLELQPAPEPQPEPTKGIFGKAMFFRVVKRVPLDPCFEPPRHSSARADGGHQWLEEGTSVQVLESKWIGEQTCRMRLLNGGWVSAIDNGEKFLRRDKAKSRAATDDENDVVLEQLAQVTTQNLQTAKVINTALTKQATELEQIDASATKAAASTGRLNASAANRLASLGKASKSTSVTTRSV